MKKCTRCKKEKDEKEFCKDRSRPDGLRCQCKECHKLPPVRPKETLPAGKKRCSKCGKVKEKEAFHKDKSRPDGVACSCKECAKVYESANREKIKKRKVAYNAKNRERKKWWFILKTYGLTQDAYIEILKSQCGACAICGKTEEGSGRALSVDHNHDTGKVRGILCSDCNVGLGLFRDDIQCLHNAIDYLSQIN